MRPGTTVETSHDGHAAQLVERMLGQASAHVAATPRRWSREPMASRPDADLIRMIPMVAAARCDLFFDRCHDRDPNAGIRPGAAKRDSIAKKRRAAKNIKKPQQPG